MSGDLPVETKKSAQEPLILRASASYDCYLPEESKDDKEISHQIGVTSFVEECYSPPKAPEVAPKCRDTFERHTIRDLHKKATTQAKVLSHLHARMDEAKNADPCQRAEMARLTALVLKDLSEKVNAVGCSSQARNAYATAEIQKGIEHGNIDLSKISARLKFETVKGNFDVKCNSRNLLFDTPDGSVNYSIKDGQLIEIRNGVEKPIGSASTRESYVFKDGQLQKIDSSQSCGGNEGPVFQLGGDGNKLNTSISTGDSKASLDKVGGYKTVDLSSENAKSLAELERKVKEAGGSGCGKDIPCNGDGNSNGNGNGRPRGDNSGTNSGGITPGGSPAHGRDIADSPIGDTSRGNTASPRLEPESRASAGPRIEAVGQREVQQSAQPSIKQSIEQSREQVVQQPNLNSRQMEVRQTEKALQQVPQSIQQAIRSSEIYPVSNAAYVAQSKIVQVDLPQLKPNLAAPARLEQVLPNVQLTDLAKLQAPITQPPVLQPNYQALFNKPVPQTNKLTPMQWQAPQMFNSLAKPNVPGADPSTQPVPSPFKVLRPTTPNQLEKTANGNGALNSLGKALNELHDSSKSATKNSPLAAARHADLVADAAPSGHTRVTDKWTNVKAISGGGGVTAGGDAGPFIPISGKIGGAGAPTGTRFEPIKNVGTKPDGKTVEGTRTQPVGNSSDSGKRVEDVKPVDTSKSLVGSSSADAVKGNEGDKGVVPVASSGNFAGSGEAVKGDRTADKQEDESTSTTQKDPGFGYTPRRRPYTVKLGETLESIATQRWGDDRLAELIRMINQHRLNVVKEDDKAVLKLAPGDILWLPSSVEAERFKKVCDIKAGGQSSLTVGFPV